MIEYAYIVGLYCFRNWDAESAYKGLINELLREIYERHLLITDYLQQAMNLSLEDAEENACRMEHVITESFMDSIKAYLNKKDLG